MAIYKAAELGRPVIIDEVNLIRPEVFMALNDVLTRRVGHTIQLPNALGSITVKSGFCMIMTGNDPDQNSKKKRYSQGRYTFDEASYNRLRVYAKSYATQNANTFTQNALDGNTVNEDERYLIDNELYGMLLQMMLQKDGALMRAGKYGFEIMKRDLDGQSLNRETFFASLKNLAHAISTIQNAYAGDVETLIDPLFKTLSLSTSIKRKVFSMRNLIEVYEAYKTDIRPMEFHLYREFIQHTTNKDEQYALLAIFKEAHFFSDLVTDKVEASLQNVKTMYQKLSKENLSIHDIENKIIVTKQDVYHEYFGNFEFSDDIFRGIEIPVEITEEESIENILESKNVVNSEDIATYCTALRESIQGQCFQIFSSQEHMILNLTLRAVQATYVDNFASQESLKAAQMAGLLVAAIHLLDELVASPDQK